MKRTIKMMFTLCSKITVNIGSACKGFSQMRYLVLSVFLISISVDTYCQSIEKIDKLVTKCNNGDTISCLKLSDIAKNSINTDIQKYVVDKIYNQKILADIAVNAKDSSIRKSAIDKISNQKILADIAINVKDSLIRKAAICKITDQIILAKLARSYTFNSIGKMAIENINDNDLLVEISLKSGDTRNCIAAIKKISDQNYLLRVINYSKNFISAADAERIDKICKVAVAELTDQTILESIAESDLNSNLREIAIAKIFNPKVLIDFTINQKDYEIRNLIIDTISNQINLLNYAKRRFALINQNYKGTASPELIISKNYFAIKMKNLIDDFCPYSVYTDIDWISYSEGVVNIRLLELEKGKNCIWCNDAKHTWLGYNENIKNVIPIILSIKDDPLQFKVKNGEYVYLQGKGYLFLPDGSIIQLPLN